MLKTTSTVGQVSSAKIRDENWEQSGKKIKVENCDKKKPVQKNCKSQTKGQKMAKSKIQIQTKKVEASKAKNLGNNEDYFLSPNLEKLLSN